MIVGLTGGLGAGKTTIAGLFQDCGAKIIDADQLARDVVKPGKPAWKEIVKKFGVRVLHSKQAFPRTIRLPKPFSVENLTRYHSSSNCS